MESLLGEVQNRSDSVDTSLDGATGQSFASQSIAEGVSHIDVDGFDQRIIVSGDLFYEIDYQIGLFPEITLIVRVSMFFKICTDRLGEPQWRSLYASYFASTMGSNS